MTRARVSVQLGHARACERVTLTTRAFERATVTGVFDVGGIPID